MRITTRAEDRLSMRGVPGGAAWMVVVLLAGLAAAIISIALLVPAARAGQWGVGAPLVVGALIGVCLAWTGADRLLRRESLVLDRSRGEGVHEVRSLLGVGARRTRFRLDDVASVRLSRRERFDPDAGEGGSRLTVVWTAELLVAEPRERVALAESQNDREAPVRAAAVAIAGFLGLPLVEDIDGVEETIGADDVGRAIIDRGAPGVPELDDPPPGSRIDLVIDPDAETVTLSWKAMGHGLLIYAGLVPALLWTGVSAVFVLGAAGVIPGGAPGPGQSAVAVAAMSVAFLALGLAMIGVLVWLRVAARRVVVITPTELRSRAPLGIQSATLPVGEITSVRTSKSDDAVLVSAGARRARLGVHLPAEGELVWLAGAVRASIRAMRA
jgi:hypothetical protein